MTNSSTRRSLPLRTARGRCPALRLSDVEPPRQLGLDLRQEVLVALQERLRPAPQTRAEHPRERAELDPRVAHVVDRAAADDRAREQAPVEPAGARTCDDVGPEDAARQPEEPDGTRRRPRPRARSSRARALEHGRSPRRRRRSRSRGSRLRSARAPSRISRCAVLVPSATRTTVAPRRDRVKSPHEGRAATGSPSPGTPPRAANRSRRYGVEVEAGILAEQLVRDDAPDRRSLHEAVAGEPARRVEPVGDHRRRSDERRESCRRARPTPARPGFRPPAGTGARSRRAASPPRASRRRSARPPSAASDSGIASTSASPRRRKWKPDSDSIVSGRSRARPATAAVSTSWRTSGRTEARRRASRASAADDAPVASTRTSASSSSASVSSSHLDTELRGAPHELARDARRVGRPVLPAEHGAEHVVRHEAVDPRGVDPLDRDAERRLHLAAPLELVQPVLGRGEEEVSDRHRRSAVLGLTS